MTQPFTAKDIIGFLDNCLIYNPGFFFMDLEHGYFHTANSRLSLYADEMRWAIVFEINGYANRGLRIELDLNYFGNWLSNLTHGGRYYHFNYNSKYIDLVSAEALHAIDADFEEVSPDAREITVRSSSVPLPRTKAEYAKWVPEIMNDDSSDLPSFTDLARYLAFEHEALMRATDAEKRQCIPADIPLVMVIDEWHQKPYYFYENGDEKRVLGTPPSSYETFGLIAEVLVSKDPSKFRPTLAPNNHWKHWPNAGNL